MLEKRVTLINDDEIIHLQFDSVIAYLNIKLNAVCQRRLPTPSFHEKCQRSSVGRATDL